MPEHMDWGRIYDDLVVPALFDRLDQAFPEFGWVRRGHKWEASDDEFTHSRFSARANRVFCKSDKPWLIGVAGGSGVTWVEYVAGAKVRGKDYIDTVRKLAGLAGVALPDAEQMSDKDREKLEALQKRASEEARKRRQAAEREKRLGDQAAIKESQELFEAAYDHTNEMAAVALGGYFECERGICLEQIEAWPWSIRFGRMYKDGSGWAVICAAIKGDEIVGVQRIQVSTQGHPIRDKDRSKIKRMLGRPSGGAVPIAGTKQTDTLVVCEGVETGLAIHAATGWCVACCLSAGFIGKYDPPHAFERIVVAADLDASGTGQKASHDAVRELQAAGRRATMTLPRAEFVPSLVASDDTPRGKSVDWLDVYNECGAEVVAERMTIAREQAVARTNEDNERIMPRNELSRARIYILECASPDKSSRASRGIYLATVGGRFYAYRGTSWRDLGRGVDAVRREVRRWAADGWNEIKIRRVQGEEVQELRPLCLAKPAIEAIVHAVSDEVMVHLDEGQESRFWLRPMFDAAGFVDWSQRAYERIDESGDNPSPSQVIALKNGLLDVDSWKRGATRLMPHTELFFNQTELPWLMPELPETVDDEIVDEIIDDLCPEWLDFLARKLRSDQDDGQAVNELQKLFGYLLTADISYQFGNLAVWVGPPGTGKSTAKTVLSELIGKRNVIATRLDLLGNGPHMAAWIDKLVAIFPDASLANKADKELATEVIKAVTGGDPLSLRKLYQDEIPNIRLTTRLLLLANEMPDLPDRSGALERRMVVWDWCVKHETEDPQIVGRLLEPKAMSGVLLWALKGLRRLGRDKGFTQPASGMTALQIFRDAATEMAEFVDDWIVIDNDEASVERCSHLYEAFCEYWTQERKRTHDPISDTRFFRQILPLLQSRGWKATRSKDRRGNRVYKGLRLQVAVSDAGDNWMSQ